MVIKREEHGNRTEKKKAKSPTATEAALFSEASREENLFETLRLLRKRLADQQAIPPYIVLSDKTLRLICERKPVTPDEFGEISGIGEFKKARYGEEFTQAIRRFLQKG